MKWSVPREWEGQTVAILGGGPSLTLEQVELARNFRRIATNNAFMGKLGDPYADVLCWNDGRWFDRNKHLIQQHKGQYKITWVSRKGMEPLGVKELEREWGKPLSAHPQRVSGGNTGHGAINLAFLFGASRILLLGFDMTSERGHNWHDYHKKHASERRYKEVFIPGLNKMAPLLKAAGVEVLNCTPGSALKCFSFARIEEIVAQRFPVEQMA